MLPSDLSLPIKEWRTGQWELANLLANDNTSSIHVLQAPPGVGKSMVALAAARLSARTTTILTGTKQLQDQYSSTFAGLVDMRGRANFPCLLTPGLTADEGICTVGEPCEYQIGEFGHYPACPYYFRKSEARDAKEVVTSYSYYLRDSGRHRGALGGRELLVLDECHELEDHLRGWWSVEITRRACEVLGVRDANPGHLPWIRKLKEQALGWLDGNSDILAKWSSSEPGLRRGFTAVERLSEELARLLPALETDPKSWVFDEGFGTVTYKPVLVEGVARDTIFKSAKSFLLMSATINTTDLLELGLGSGDYTYRSVPSPFPVGNRPLLYWPVCKVRAALTEGELSAWIKRIDEILEMHPDEKGLIHTANYKLAQLLLERSRFRSRLTTHTGMNRSDALDSFRTSTAPLAMVSPSMTTGVDLPYDLCRFQIIAKLNWLYLGDPQVARRLQMPNGDRWYANRAASSLGQAYGRGVRAIDDAATTYLIDQTFDQLWNRWAYLLPPWVLEAIIKI